MPAQFPSEATAEGEFQRQEDAFRHGLEGPPETGRYHLVVSLACPWAHRALLVRELRGLQAAVGVSVVDPIRDERGWRFDGRDPETGFRFLSEAYAASDPAFAGRVTVPVLWDRARQRIANNSEDDICRMFCRDFAPLSATPVDLFPRDIDEEQDELSRFIYDNLANGVYGAGFATAQAPYEENCRAVFSALDVLEARLEGRRYLFGERMVESDLRLFCVLVRFDAVYFGHFKCNLRRIADHPNLSRFLRDMYWLPGVRETVNIDHIKRHYYMTHTEINPTGIVPLGPELPFLRP